MSEVARTPPAPESVVDALYARPYGFDFYQAVRLLQWQHRRTPAAQRPADPVRFSARLSLDAPAAEIYELTAPEAQGAGAKPRPPEMVVNFFGLTGPSGALPVHYTELLLDRRFRHRDRTLARFLDIFNHRLTTLFHEAWSKYHIFVDYERETREGFTRALRDLIGLGTDGLTGRLARAGLGVRDQTLIYYGGILAQRPHSAAGLEAICRDYFGVPARVRSFQGRRLHLQSDECSALGVANCSLGDGALLGQEVWDMQSKFRVQVGPLDAPDFLNFLPNGSGFVALARMGNFYAGPDLDFDIQVIARRDQVPPAQLGGTGEAASFLGWNSWVKAGDFDHDPDDAVFGVGKSPRWRPGEGSGARGMAGTWRPPEAQAIRPRGSSA